MKISFPVGIRNQGLCLGGLAVVCCAVGMFLWIDKPLLTPTATTGKATGTPALTSTAVPDFREPAEDFNTYLHVLQTGGCEITRPVAIAWLDCISRENIALPEDQSSRVMEMIAEGGHHSWASGYRQHLFNSAFNALHRSRIGKPFTLRLLHLSLHDSDRIMRLYALQHLGAQRRAGHLPDSPLSEKVKISLLELAKAREEEVSGYAIDLLTSWDGGGDGEPEPSIRDLALATAADTLRPVDIRVTALHAAGSASLPLARVLAASTDQHVMLRKAAIARIGQHGTDEDFESLEALRAESGRLAQAAEPALARLRESRNNAHQPHLAPY